MTIQRMTYGVRFFYSPATLLQAFFILQQKDLNMQKVSYIYSGETRTFYFNFPYFEKSNIVVTVDNKPAPAYNVIGNKGGSNPDFPFTSGRIVFEKPLKKFETITIERHLPYVRPVDFQPTVQITPSALNLDMNYTMELLKDIKDEFDSFREKYADIVDKESTNLLLEKIALVNQNIAEVSEQIESVDGITDLPDDVAELQEALSGLSGNLSDLTDTVDSIDLKTSSITDYLVDSQEPTAENNYTWYRKYHSGWVEQGGYVANSGNEDLVIQLPITMANTYYKWSVGMSYNNANEEATYKQVSIWDKTTTGFTIRRAGNIVKSWSIAGMGA